MMARKWPAKTKNPDDGELLMRASAVLKSQGSENWSRGRPGPHWARKSTLHRAPVGQGPSGPDWLAISFGFWSGRALATGTAWAGLCLIHHHLTGRVKTRALFGAHLAGKSRERPLVGWRRVAPQVRGTSVVLFCLQMGGGTCHRT